MEAKCVMFDCGGVLVSDMSWDLIINASEKDKQADVEAAIKEQWALMRVDPNYSESSFWIGNSFVISSFPHLVSDAESRRYFR
jgi:hypothetical protein